MKPLSRWPYFTLNAMPRSNLGYTTIRHESRGHHTKLLQLLTTERRQQFSTELVGPIVQEVERTGSAEARLGRRGGMELRRERAGTRTGCGVSGTMAVKEVHLSELTPGGNGR